MKKLYGTITATITPFTKEDSVDIASLEDYIDYLIEKGTDCLYPCGSTGEMSVLSIAERKLVAETVVKTNSGRVTVFVQTGAATLKETIELSRHAQKIGADGIGVVTPWYLTLSEEELEDFYVAVAESVSADFPIYLYGIPQCASNDISVDLAERITDRCKNVIGIKYSYPDMMRILKYMDIKGGSFSVLTGVEQFYAMTAMFGADGVVAGTSSVIPECFAALTSAIKEGDRMSVIALQRKVNEYNDLLGNRNSIACSKAILKAQGIIRTKKMRAPIREISDAEGIYLFAECNNLRK